MRAQTDGWRADVAALLERRAAAVVAGDRGAFRATMSFAPSGFVEDRLAWFDRLRALPLAAYDLELDPDAWEDLAPALRRLPAADEVHVVTAAERIRFRGYDRDASAEALFLTVARRGGRWAVVADDALEGVGLLSSRNLWDFAPVRTVAGDGVMVLFHDEADAASRIRGEAARAVAFVRDAWPLGWDRPVILAIPRSSADLGRIFGTTIDLGPFVAFAASSVLRRDAGFRLVAPRIYIQPDTFFGYSEAFQRDTLAHEMLHAATRHDAGWFTTAWIEEGVAQIFGERAAPSYGDLAARVRAGTFDGRLPEAHEFAIGSRERIHAAYDESASFIAFLVDRFGREPTARFYRAVGRETPVSFGTPEYHLDRASRTTFGVAFDDLEARWAATVRARYG